MVTQCYIKSCWCIGIDPQNLSEGGRNSREEYKMSSKSEIR